MPIPDFITELRRHVGHAELWLSGVTAVVIRELPGESPQVLLVQRADNLAWTPVTGIIDPGEHPADTAEREVLEEAGITARALWLAQVDVSDPHVHVNGDRARYLNLTLRCEYLDGDPAPADDECVACGWFSLDALPPLSERMLGRIHAALREDRTAVLDR